MSGKSDWDRYLETCRAASGTGMVEVTFELPPRYRPMRRESMWAARIGPDVFVLENSPFHAEGVSYLDTVRARLRRGEWFFVEVHARGGHSTFRVFLEDPWRREPWPRPYAPLKDLGCAIEVARQGWAAVDVPPTADIFAVRDALRRGEAEGRWRFEEAHFGHPSA